MVTRGTTPIPPGGQVTDLSLLGGRLCLDFVNTIDPRHGEHPREFLTTYADLATWAGHAGAVPLDDVGELLRQGDQNHDSASATFERARQLRQQLYRIFSAVAADEQPSPDAIDYLNEALAEAMAHSRLLQNADGSIVWGWDASLTLDRAWWPVTRSAAELLTSDRRDRLRECPGPDGCGWLFYDTSRNGSRRWCSMEGCGNRAKGRRHYQRATAATAARRAAPARPRGSG